MQVKRFPLCVALGVFVAFPCWSGPITVTRVWPEKICYRPGDTAAFEVEISNTGNTTENANLKVAVRWGLDKVDTMAALTLAVPANGKATAKVTYQIPGDRKWGHEVVAILTDAAGAVQSTGREYFTVGENPWELGHYLTLFWIGGKKKNGAIDGDIIPRYRKGYVTMIEAFSWEPSVFDNMAPSMEAWRSGQGDYKETREDWQYLIQRAHDNGMAAVSYIQSISYGPYGLEFVRKHPDWLTYGEDGRPNGWWFDVDKLATLQENPETETFIPDSGGFSAGVFLPSKQQVSDYWIKEVMRSKEMFKWDGIRSDGNPTIASGRDYKGKLYEVKEVDAANAELIERIRQELMKKYPDFKFGWNYPVCDTMGGGYGLKGMPKQMEKMIPGSYMLWEAFNAAGQPSSVLHKWKRMAEDLHCEVSNCRERGGFSHVGWMGSNRYLEAVASACGTQTDSWGDAKYANYRRFEFRWAEFLWDTALRYVRPATDAVNVEAPAQIWWQDFVHSRDLPNGGRRVVVHLLNMPSNDDEGWADRPPAPATNVRVTFKVPAGKKLTKVVALSPDVDGDVMEVTPGPDGAVTLPQVTVWTMVVAELGA